MSRGWIALALVASAGFAWGQGPGSGGNGGGACARRGGGSATAAMTATLEPSGSGTTTAALTATALLGSSASNTALASRTFLLERQLAAQQAYLQYWQQQMVQQQAQAAADQAAQATGERQQRLRRLNAERALVSARRAEMNGKTSVAARHYRRVVELASQDESLTREAREALGRLESPQGPALAAKRR